MCPARCRCQQPGKSLAYADGRASSSVLSSISTFLSAEMVWCAWVRTKSDLRSGAGKPSPAATARAVPGSDAAGRGCGIAPHSWDQRQGGHNPHSRDTPSSFCHPLQGARTLSIRLQWGQQLTCCRLQHPPEQPHPLCDAEHRPLPFGPITSRLLAALVPKQSSQSALQEFCRNWVKSCGSPWGHVPPPGIRAPADKT